MSSLGSTMMGAASALRAFQYALGVSQNNVGNASTPGYAKQIATLEAGAFDPLGGLAGGVTVGPLVDGRDLLAENDVWQQAAAQGDASARGEALAAVENAIPVADGAGIPAALNTFLGDVSAWSTAPGDGTIRQNVMDSAATLAQTFNAAAGAVSTISRNVTQTISSTLDQINQLTSQIASLNTRVDGSGHTDAGVQAQLFSALETLSGLVDIRVMGQPGGSLEVSLAGGAPLVIGGQAYSLSQGSAQALPVTDPQGPPQIAVFGSDGARVDSQITSGKLHGLLEVRNLTIPGLIGDTSQPGALNEMAAALAGRVNEIVSQGFVSAGVPAPAGLFTIDPAHPASAAGSLAVDPAMSARQLPALDGNGVPNGVPLALAALANPQQESDRIDTLSFTEFYGLAAARVGSQASRAADDSDLAGQSLAQAKSMRQAQSGVSLDAEAINVLQLQTAYQAVAKMVGTLDELMKTLMNMIPG